MKTITFYYRGLIERGADYHWTEGWSAKGSTGGVLYPWSTKRECQSEAKSKGAKAVFVREEDKPRDSTSHTEAINAANQPQDDPTVEGRPDLYSPTRPRPFVMKEGDKEMVVS